MGYPLYSTAFFVFDFCAFHAQPLLDLGVAEHLDFRPRAFHCEETKDGRSDVGYGRAEMWFSKISRQLWRVFIQGDSAPSNLTTLKKFKRKTLYATNATHKAQAQAAECRWE
jgi:hypothetical protein